jgi:hypothetical protein
MFGHEGGHDVGHHLVSRGVRTVTEPLYCLAAVVIPDNPAEADHGPGSVRLHRGNGLVHRDGLRAEDRVDYFED